MNKNLKSLLKKMIHNWDTISQQEAQAPLGTVDPPAEYRVKNQRSTEELFLDFSHRPYVSILKDSKNE